MILYMDTSALLKKYFKEPGSNEVISRWKDKDFFSLVMTKSFRTLLRWTVYRLYPLRDVKFNTASNITIHALGSAICIGLT